MSSSSDSVVDIKLNAKYITYFAGRHVYITDGKKLDKLIVYRDGVLSCSMMLISGLMKIRILVQKILGVTDTRA
jgi:hypothetical protein